MGRKIFGFGAAWDIVSGLDGRDGADLFDTVRTGMIRGKDIHTVRASGQSGTDIGLGHGTEPAFRP